MGLEVHESQSKGFNFMIQVDPMSDNYHVDEHLKRVKNTHFKEEMWEIFSILRRIFLQGAI